MFPQDFQIISDLHLETPLPSPSYKKLRLDIKASNLCLLGDIGLVQDAGLFAFLRSLLRQSRGNRIFYVIGNHEPYQSTHELAIQKLRSFEDEARREFGGRFVLLDRNRYDLDASTTILGCTLWSAISAEQASEAQARLTDFGPRGIRDWTLEHHLIQHRQDLEWLNVQVRELQEREPHRQVGILTHHSPTIDSRATDPQHSASPVSSCFASDLSHELCWKSPQVKLWAFGHTHYSCAFRDESTRKLVVTNQMGYHTVGERRAPRAKSMVVEATAAEWIIVQVQDGEAVNSKDSPRSNAKEDNSKKMQPRPDAGNAPPKSSLLQRAAHRVQAFGAAGALCAK